MLLSITKWIIVHIKDLRNYRDCKSLWWQFRMGSHMICFFCTNLKHFVCFLLYIAQWMDLTNKCVFISYFVFFPPTTDWNLIKTNFRIFSEQWSNFSIRDISIISGRWQIGGISNIISRLYWSTPHGLHKGRY